jgi:DNA polymerase-1
LNHVARIVLQLHDELMIEVRASALNEIARIVRNEMKSAWSLRVPLIVKLQYGSNWGDRIDLKDF